MFVGKRRVDVQERGSEKECTVIDPGRLLPLEVPNCFRLVRATPREPNISRARVEAEDPSAGPPTVIVGARGRDGDGSSPQLGSALRPQRLRIKFVRKKGGWFCTPEGPT